MPTDSPPITRWTTAEELLGVSGETRRRVMLEAGVPRRRTCWFEDRAALFAWWTTLRERTGRLHAPPDPGPTRRAIRRAERKAANVALDMRDLRRKLLATDGGGE